MLNAIFGPNSNVKMGFRMSKYHILPEFNVKIEFGISNFDKLAGHLFCAIDNVAT